MVERTLRELLESELQSQGESVTDLMEIKVSEGVGFRAGGSVSKTIHDLEDYSGDTGFGGQNLPNLYAYTPHRVYFKVHYDGAESVGSVPRNPSDESVESYGGG